MAAFHAHTMDVACISCGKSWTVELTTAPNTVIKTVQVILLMRALART
jgi:hypothetical protein